MHKRYISLALVTVGLFAVQTLPARSVVHADSKEFNFTTGCTESSEGSYTAIQNIETPKDAYVKLGARGQTLPVSTFQVNESLEGGCRAISTQNVNGNSWTKVGTLQPSDERVVLEVISPALASVPDANRPMVLLLDSASPICNPTIECNTVYDGVPAYIMPPSTLRDQASLSVGVPVDPDDDTLTGVDYFVDGKRVYSTKSLEPFDTRFVSYASQPLLRVAKYASGQEVVYPTQVPDGYSDTFANFIFRFLNLNSLFARIGFGIGAALLTILLIYLSLKLFSNRYKRMINRNLVIRGSIFDRLAAKIEPWLERMDRSLAIKSGTFIVTLGRQKQTFKYIAIFWIVPIVVIGGYYTIKNQIGAVYKVNGESMTNTLQDRQSLLVFKLPKSLANLDGRQMELKRGDVVVADVVYGLVSPEDIEANQHTIVKRVLALPGERITVKDGATTVYNKDYPEGIEVDKNSEWANTMIKDPNPVPLDIKLGADEVFLSGDNRPGSIDSRVNGPVKTSQIVGRVVADW